MLLITTRKRMGTCLAIAAVAGATLLAGCGKRQAAPAAAKPTQVVAVMTAQLPASAEDPQWAKAPEFAAMLLPQDIVEPRLAQPSTTTVRVKTMTDGRQVAYRLEWDDATTNDMPQAAHFSDACAVQTPAVIGAKMPSPQMGETGKPVSITFWRAFWQSVVDGHLSSLSDVYPNAKPDHYPFEAPILQGDPAAKDAAASRYAPSHARGNEIAAPSNAPVQDLIAEGPGSLAPAPHGATLSTGQGKRTASGYVVIMVRALPAPVNGPVQTQVAFAVWDGGKDEVGSRKMRTDWVPMLLGGQ